jgi:hypothetical protein
VGSWDGQVAQSRDTEDLFLHLVNNLVDSCGDQDARNKGTVDLHLHLQSSLVDS